VKADMVPLKNPGSGENTHMENGGVDKVIEG